MFQGQVPSFSKTNRQPKKERKKERLEETNTQTNKQTIQYKQTRMTQHLTTGREEKAREENSGRGKISSVFRQLTRNGDIHSNGRKHKLKKIRGNIITLILFYQAIYYHRFSAI